MRVLTNCRVLDSFLELCGSNVASDLGLCIDMAIDNSISVNDTRPPARPARLVAFMQYLPQVSSDAGGVDDIVKRQMRDKLGLLQKQRKRLADTTSSTAYTDFDHGFNNNIVSSSRTKEKRKNKGISALSKAITKKSTPLAQVGTWRRPRHVNE